MSILSSDQYQLPGTALLFLTASDCPLTEFLKEVRRLLAFEPKILAAIERDLDQYALKKKAERLADWRWHKRQSVLPGQEEGNAQDGPKDPKDPKVKSLLTLKQGRPRMKPTVYYFSSHAVLIGL